MNGAIIPHTPIAVDVWNRKAVSSCRLFFLSHAHSDHTTGLTSSWKHHKIYCSEVTKDIVIHKLGVCNDLLVGIPVEKTITIPMDEYGQEKLTVTLIDANHCPGAVMFLFEGYFGTVLYTGDFRYNKCMTEHIALKDKIIDRLYLDNTYCDPMCSFPSREEASSKVLDIVENHLKKDFKIVIGMSALGKEDLLVKIAMAHQTWIGVDPKRLSLLKLLNLPDVFTSDVESTRVQVVMQREVTKQNLQEWNDIEPTIAILPTALFEGDTNPYQYMSNVFVVPFSDHSSYAELVSFVSSIKPKEIIPIVLKHRCTRMEPNNTRTNMTIFNSYLNKKPFNPVLIPDSVLKYMNVSTKGLRVKRRSNSRYNCHEYKRRCDGVVFPDDQPVDVSKRQSEDKVAKELPDRNENCLKNDSLNEKRRIESSCNIQRDECQITQENVQNDLFNYKRRIKSSCNVQTDECQTTQDNVQNDSFNYKRRIESSCNEVQSDKHITSQDSLQTDPLIHEIVTCQTHTELHSDRKKNSFSNPSPLDHSSNNIEIISDNESYPDKNGLLNVKSNYVKCKDVPESEMTSHTIGVEKDISKKHLIGDGRQKSMTKGKKRSLLDYWGYQRSPNTETAITSAAANNYNNSHDNQVTEVLAKPSKGDVNKNNYCTDIPVSSTTTLSCQDTGNNSDDDSLNGFCWFTSDFNFVVKK